MAWRKEAQPIWDENKRRIIKNGPFNLDVSHLEIDGRIGVGPWWVYEDTTRPIAYAWLSCDEEECELSIAVDAERQRQSIGSSVLELVEGAAQQLGYLKVVATIRNQNPDRMHVIAFLRRNGFVPEAPHDRNASDEEFKKQLDVSGSIAFEKHLSC